MKKVCLIYNFAQHYRTNIFTLLDRELNCDFVFGNNNMDIKKMDYSLLSNFKKEVTNKTFIHSPFYYQKGVLSLLNKKYTSYLILGDLHCISTWLILLLAKFYQKNVYLWSHGWYGKEGRFRSTLKKAFFGLASGTFLYGNYARNLMIKEGLDASKLFVIYNSLAYDKHLMLRNSTKKTKVYSTHFENDNKNLIFLGRLTKIKKLDMIFFALSRMKNKGQNYNLILVGEGETEIQLKSLAEKLGLLNIVWFYGACYDEKILAELIYNADLCVSPGNVGLTAIHSMSFGTPVLTHNNFPYQMPEFEAIEEGKTGAFFNYGSYESLSNSINRWFLSTPDRKIIRQECYRTIDTKYNPHIQLETFRKHLK